MTMPPPSPALPGPGPQASSPKPVAGSPSPRGSIFRPPGPSNQDLPPSARRDTTTARSIQRLPWRSLIKPAIFVGLALTIGSLLRTQSGEEGFGNWKHHQHAEAHAAADGAVKWISPLGPARFINGLVVSPDDIDTKTSEAVFRHVASGDYQAAEQAMRDAQQDVPDPQQALDDLEDPPQTEAVYPTLSQGLVTDIRRGGVKFFHIYMYDSCAEDGDIIEILINGTPFATVPITHAGSTLSVPIPQVGHTVVAVKGVYDGGGGITVACQTSQGDGFIRVMAPGEEQILSTVLSGG